jgi:hypothetical protein
VVNDKYQGVNADCEQAIQAIKRQHQLEDAGFKTASNLEDLLFSLDDDQIIIFSISNTPPRFNLLKISLSISHNGCKYIFKCLPIRFMDL